MKLKTLFALLVLSGCLALAQVKPACAPKPTPPPTPTPVTGTITNTNSNTNVNTSTATSTSTSSANANQQQSQQQSQSAAGGNASATGGGNGSNDNTSNVHVAASAISPPILPTVPCFKGAGAAAQVGMIGGSFGAGKVDQGCDDRELARSFSGPQTPASCMILINTKKAKKIGITLAQCLNIQPPAPAPEPPAPIVQAPPQVIVVPVTVAALPLPVVAPITVSQPSPKSAQLPKNKPVHHLAPECQNVITKVCATKK